MNKQITNFPQIFENYHALMQDLDCNVVPTSAQNLAKAYFSFTQSVNKAFQSQKFSSLSQAWSQFEPYFESKPFNLFSLSMTVGDMDYVIKKSYLDFLLLCQHSISELLFDCFVFDLPFYDKHKKHLPAFILFVNWLDSPYTRMEKYFDNFTQNHFDCLSYYNNLPELEFFINALFLRSKSEVDMNSFDTEFLNFNTENLKKVNEKQFYLDIILKKNSIELPEQFIDYVKFIVAKFMRDPVKRQSTLEANEIKNFLTVYEKQKLEFLLPTKNIKFKTAKI